ncbi:Atu4866 domain-containing protein [Roseomonas marmotae]|uniref:Atu4866 domain-containing protein n=1 Tax=Roseomonas marmotae TaxID=2768161 RepID=A0ABS3K735_9PROT|nr:Atu4866 domain-containing protein [Roseomonas marmotae]MBO1073273.1 Atu4866 domain-containing protein [Roseomonas marmotae]QTI79107.1 Atu4866 domain-containing protein [Roseomonas marmotae]
MREVLLGGAVLALLAATAALPHHVASAQSGTRQEAGIMADHPYTGMWVTSDRHVRQELLPNGRYDEARGQRQSAYQGRYEVRGSRVLYWDDTGFTADGEFRDDILYHGGMIFYRDGQEPR